jgi:hypothetical protein
MLPITDEELRDINAFEYIMFEQSRWPLDWDFMNCPEATVHDAGARRFMDALGNACHSRRSFRTSSGHIGIGLEAIQGADVIVVLYGGDVPFVVGPAENGQHLLLGPCYVHGIMYGEAMKRHMGQEGDDVVYSLV